MSGDTTDNQQLMAAKTAMLLHVPFFASLLLDMMILKVGKFDIFPPGNATAATDGKHIWIDEDFMKTLSLPEIVFLICHEVGHAMWGHMSRGKKYLDVGFEGRPFSPMLWNVAGDFIINDMLVQAKIGTMPSCGLHDTNIAGQSDLLDDVYRKLEQRCKNNSKGGGMKGDGKGGGGYDDKGNPVDSNGNPMKTIDHHVLTPSKVGETEWKRACKTAATAAKAMGKLPGSLERYVDQLLNPKVPWQEKLRYHVTRAVSKDATTWARPHRRRLVNQGIVMPSYTGFSAGEVVVAVDTSGSISEKELTVFLTELQSILDVCKPERTWILAIDAQVHDVTEIESGDSLVDNVPPLRGGGGTAFEPAFNWVEEESKTPTALIYFTDMYGSFPNQAPMYPVIWCATSDHEAPWGEVIQLDLNEYDDE